MTYPQQPQSQYPYQPQNLPNFPEKKRRTGWWIAAAVVVIVAAVAATVIANNNDDPSYKADSDLEKLLLTSDEFPSGFDTSILSEEELNQQNQSQGLPGDIQPAECAELLESQPQPTGEYAYGGVQAKNTSTNTFYIEAVTPAAGVDDWNANQINELLDTCGNTTFSEDGASGSITFSKLRGIDGDGFALRMTVEAEGTEITLGVAVTKVGKHVVIFTGGTAGQFDETEFVQLATAANDKVNAEL